MDDIGDRIETPRLVRVSFCPSAHVFLRESGYSLAIIRLLDLDRHTDVGEARPFLRVNQVNKVPQTPAMSSFQATDRLLTPRS